MEPVDAIRGCPGLILVSVQAMDGDDAEENARTNSAARETSSLDDGIDPFCHNLQTLRAYPHSRICCLRRTFGLSSAISRDADLLLLTRSKWVQPPGRRHQRGGDAQDNLASVEDQATVLQIAEATP